MTFDWLEEGTLGEKIYRIMWNIFPEVHAEAISEEVRGLCWNTLCKMSFLEMLQQAFWEEEYSKCKTFCVGKMKAMGGQER